MSSSSFASSQLNSYRPESEENGTYVSDRLRVFLPTREPRRSRLPCATISLPPSIYLPLEDMRTFDPRGWFSLSISRICCHSYDPRRKTSPSENLRPLFRLSRTGGGWFVESELRRSSMILVRTTSTSVHACGFSFCLPFLFFFCFEASSSLSKASLSKASATTK